MLTAVKRQFNVVTLLVLFLVFGVFTVTEVSAQWTDAGNVNGIPVYRDNAGREWTRTLQRTATFGSAQQIVTNLGFRLPSHSEFRSLEGNGGIQKLNIDTSWAAGFYWETTGGLVNGNGGNFGSLFPSNRARTGDPYAIGVRNAGSSTTTPPTPPTDNGGWDIPPTDPTDNGGGSGSTSPPGGDNTFDGMNAPKPNYRLILITLQSDEAGTAPGQKVNNDNIVNTLSLFNGSKTLIQLHTSRDGKTIGNQAVLNAIRNANVGSNDVLFFYYGGHGGCIENTREQYWGLENADRSSQDTLYRKDVRSALLAKGARLTVLISDCCSSTQAEIERGNLLVFALTKKQNNLSSLLAVRGLVDVTSAEFRQFSISNSEKGGFFTQSFCSALISETNWRDVISSATTGTQNKYTEARNACNTRIQSGKPRGNDRDMWRQVYQYQATQTPWIITQPLP